VVDFLIRTRNDSFETGSAFYYGSAPPETDGCPECTLYDKDEVSDLTPEEKKRLKQAIQMELAARRKK